MNDNVEFKTSNYVLNSFTNPQMIKRDEYGYSPGIHGVLPKYKKVLDLDLF